jgi:hypothetical protein
MLSFILVTKRTALAATLMTCWVASSLAGPPEAQGAQADPVTLARLRTGEIVREIADSRRDPSRPEPSQLQVLNTALLLQAGLRALLPVDARQGIALPGIPSTKDPKPLVEAQENYKAVFESGADAAASQKEIALQAIRTAAQQLSEEGYEEFSTKISEWLQQSCPNPDAFRAAHDGQAPECAGGPASDPTRGCN